MKFLKRLFRKNKVSIPFVFDATGIEIDYGEILSRSNGKPVLINLPVNMLRIIKFRNFKCELGCANPFVNTVKEIIDSDIDYSKSSLYNYYNTFKPESAADVLGITTHDNNSCYLKTPYSVEYPWNGLPSKKREEKVKQVTRKENFQNGLTDDQWHGASNFGPVSEEKGRLEFNRLKNLLYSIKNKGYQRSDDKDGDIKVNIFTHKNRYSFIVKSGHHRAAVLAAMEVDSVPVRVMKNDSFEDYIISKKTCNEWLPIKRNYLNKKQIIEMFDKWI